MKWLICHSKDDCRYKGDTVYTNKGGFPRCTADVPCTAARDLPESGSPKIPSLKDRIERVKTIRNLCDIALVIDKYCNVDVRETLLPTILETLYEQAQANVEEFCVAELQ